MQLLESGKTIGTSVGSGETKKEIRDARIIPWRFSKARRTSLAYFPATVSTTRDILARANCANSPVHARCRGVPLRGARSDFTRTKSSQVPVSMIRNNVVSRVSGWSTSTPSSVRRERFPVTVNRPLVSPIDVQFASRALPFVRERNRIRPVHHPKNRTPPTIRDFVPSPIPSDPSDLLLRSR